MKHFFPEPEDASERELFERVDRYDGPAGLVDLTPERLCELTAREGCDFATALLHRSIVQSPEHGPFLRELGGVPVPPAPGVRAVVVPGAFYQENPRTGADGRLPRETAQNLGMETAFVPLSGTGSLAENARFLTDWLLAQGDTPLVLLSVSKGGSDIKAALMLPEAPRAFARVRGWINLCGILDGTPMANWLLSPSWLARANRLVYRIRGRSLDFLGDMQQLSSCSLNGPLLLPAGLRTVHVLGFPLRRHFHNGLVRRCHQRLEPLGPNDGAILLSQAAHWPGQICPVWGSDHYLQPRIDVKPLLVALLGICSRQ